MMRLYPAILLCLLLLPPSAWAVPTLLPLVPLVAALVAKGAALLGSAVFLALAFFKRHRRGLFLALGLVAFGAFVLLMVFYRHG